MNTLVLGIGNPLLGDDGFGVEVVRRLRERGGLPSAEVLDGGSIGLYLLPHLEGRSHVLVVDAIDFGGTPGEMVRLRSEQIPSYVGLKVSEHQVTFHEVLALMDLLDIKPQEFLFFGVQPKGNSWGQPMSTEVSASVEPTVKRVVSQIESWRDTDHDGHERSSHPQ
jgi:hydrogenase maturation protease